LVTAGPTVEPIDPVRFISNHSSGKMGYAIAGKLAFYGARVTLISGPTSETIKTSGIDLIKVQTASEMHGECLSRFSQMDGALLVAAVADYKPRFMAGAKIKRTEQKLMLELEPNPDIAADLGKQKRKDQFLAGFALETHDGIRNALAKLKRKNFDFIVLNTLQDKGAGFADDTNKITILDRRERIKEFPLKSKQEVAEDIVNFLHTII
jgi:phosphopantothenoylcysteine decarboxylase/phosphopantothenate--cysteine ligase